MGAKKKCPSEIGRVTAKIDTAALAAVGYRLNNEHRGWAAPNGSIRCVQGPAQRLAALVEQAEKGLKLTRPQWNTLADLLSGLPLVDNATVADGIGRTVADVLDTDPDGRKVLARLADPDGAIPPLAVEVVLSAVRFLRYQHRHVDRHADEWWTVAFRKQLVARLDPEPEPAAKGRPRIRGGQSDNS